MPAATSRARRPATVLISPGNADRALRRGAAAARVVEVLELQPAGKQRMAAAEFLRGQPPPARRPPRPGNAMNRPPHSSGQPHDARSLALQVLLDCRRDDAFVQEVLDRHLQPSRLLPPPTAGWRRNWSTACCAAAAPSTPCCGRWSAAPPHQVEPWLWEALRLGAYQLALLTHVPPHAALHETVELAAASAGRAAKGFLNGVLRPCAACHRRPHRRPGRRRPAAGGRQLPPAGPAGASRPGDASGRIPGGCLRPAALAGAALAASASAGTSACGWASGSPARRRCGCASTRCGPTATRCLAALAEAGIAAEPGEHPQAVRLPSTPPIRDLPGYAEGWFSVQDESAMRVASALAPEPGRRVLDLCAAPGGKTTHLAELMRQPAAIVACDVDDGPAADGGGAVPAGWA